MKTPMRGAILALTVATLALAIVLVCDPAPSTVEDWPQASIRIDGEWVDVRIAKTSRTRSQGFQHATPEQIRSEKILFIWPDQRQPSFHMENVACPLVIAWIADGTIVATEHMKPGRALYRPPQPVDAALELHPERAEDLGIKSGTEIDLSRDDPRDSGADPP
ncbi:hypothetical protein CKO15_06360 [Halorhodospira abdelmalekii]|uniref:DUF192 domain-containing protein n=1 Tax=Halorhodospira abdelmalekii TaxID=421629 RepID=UPI0019085DD4|nr:DUF192 domain-containing protein [Halorhodospira abdelmalekii]MBK1734914.1 hypothetical protein [Halorhodospira abdelmalekii]